MGLFAYIDPGTGSLFIQAVIGIVLAGGVFFRNFFKKAYQKLKRLFSSKRKTNELEATGDEE